MHSGAGYEEALTGGPYGTVILTLLSDEESRDVNTIAAHISTMSRQAPEQPRQGEVC